MARFWFQDFVPRRTRQPGLLRLADYEPFENAVIQANRWIEEQGVRVLRFETVVLPNIWSEHEQGTTDSSLGSSLPSHWHQFVRVWFEDTSGEHEVESSS